MKLALTLILLTASSSWAGYDRTTWGMPLKEVQKLYPDGVVQPKQDKTADYAVIKSIAGQTAVVLFNFDTTKRLDSVTILFPKAGSSIDLKGERYDAASKAESATIYNLLTNLLSQKYGAPASTNPETGIILWRLDNGDIVGLNKAKDEVGVGIVYSKGELPTNGL